MIKVTMVEQQSNFKPYYAKSIQCFAKGQILCNQSGSLCFILTSVNIEKDTMTFMELTEKSFGMSDYSGMSLTNLMEEINSRKLFFVKDYEIKILKLYNLDSR